MADRERIPNPEDEEPNHWEGTIEPTAETREEIGRWIEEQRRFQDDVRLAAVVLGVDWLLFD